MKSHRARGCAPVSQQLPESLFPSALFLRAYIPVLHFCIVQGSLYIRPMARFSTVTLAARKCLLARGDTLTSAIMLLFIVLSNLLCLLLPAFAFPHRTTSEDSVNIAAHHVKRLSNPLRNLLHKRDAILSAGGPNAPNALALNSTTGNIRENLAFDNTIDIPGQGHAVYFIVCQTGRMIDNGFGDDANLVGKGQG